VKPLGGRVSSGSSCVLCLCVSVCVVFGELISSTACLVLSIIWYRLSPYS
jgi:hypothetical protein